MLFLICIINTIFHIMFYTGISLPPSLLPFIPMPGSPHFQYHVSPLSLLYKLLSLCNVVKGLVYLCAPLVQRILKVLFTLGSGQNDQSNCMYIFLVFSISIKRTVYYKERRDNTLMAGRTEPPSLAARIRYPDFNIKENLE